MKRGAVISGGGAWGAYGGGTLARLNNNYNTIVGISTGSLLAPFAALREWELLREGYTNVNNKNVFDNFWYKPNPLSNDGKLRKIPIIISMILGQNSVSTSNALRKTIETFFPKILFDELMKQNKEIIVGTQNYAQTPSKIHYFSSLNENYIDFCDWMWCSANFPFFTSLVKKSWRDDDRNFHLGLWGDGGLTDLIGINQLMNKGFNEIDIILHRTKIVDVYEGHQINNLIDNVTSCINAMRYDIEFEYFYNKIKKLNKQGTKVTIYWLPRKLSKNSMVFNRKEMNKWWLEGYETAFDPDRIEIFEPNIKN